MSNTPSPAELMQAWLLRQLNAEAAAWLTSAVESLATDASDRTFYKLFGFVPRKIGKADLQLAGDDFRHAQAARDGWDPHFWSVDQAGRLLLLLRSEPDSVRFFARTEQLFATADVGELVALYRGLPLYPDPARFVRRGTEGVRSSMKAVFEAVAHRNPFPAEQFDENAWNQMVLKALFIGSPLTHVQGIDRRTNPTLRRMLVDYAHERWAASRPVSPELWRCVGPHADQAAVTDLARVLARGTVPERRAAALALAACPLAAARVALAEAPELAAGISSGAITWDRLDT